MAENQRHTVPKESQNRARVPGSDLQSFIERNGQSSDIAWSLTSVLEKDPHSLHKLESGSTTPGQLERSIKRIPKHHIIRTNRFQKPPSTRVECKRKTSVSPAHIYKTKITPNAPDLNAPRNALALRRAEIRIARFEARPVPSPAAAAGGTHKVLDVHDDCAVKRV